MGVAKLEKLSTNMTMTHETYKIRMRADAEKKNNRATLKRFVKFRFDVALNESPRR